MVRAPGGCRSTAGTVGAQCRGRRGWSAPRTGAGWTGGAAAGRETRARHARRAPGSIIHFRVENKDPFLRENYSKFINIRKESLLKLIYNIHLGRIRSGYFSEFSSDFINIAL